jgi:hypothetical protein
MSNQKSPKKTQKEKQERGTKGEAEITASLTKAKLWNHKFANAGFGTVFDKLAVLPGGGYGLEIKVRQEPTIAYNLSSIPNNERKGLDKFVKLVGEDYAYIIGIWKTEEFERAFLIKWVDVRDAVCSGERGSVKMLDFPELEKIAGGWDMSWMKRRG